MNSTSALFERMPRLLLWTSLGHALVGVVCLAALCVTAAPVMGVHPALKPLKFALSIALFLATMGVLLPSLSVSPMIRNALAWLFAATMVAEMVPIVVQSCRGTTSHFNVRGALNSATWNMMVLAIALATIGMVCVAILASLRPLIAEDDQEMAPLMAFSWRAGLWLLLLAPVSGFRMGGRLQHSIGGDDGGLGLPFVNWSVLHGDLRVAHFFALHTVQLLPILAWILLRVVAGPWARWGLLSTAALGATALCVGTLVQAFAGRPFIQAVAHGGPRQPEDSIQSSSPPGSVPRNKP
jgi:hypothetical protein